jgi:hypothetical protein
MLGMPSQLRELSLVVNTEDLRCVPTSIQGQLYDHLLIEMSNLDDFLHPLHIPEDDELQLSQEPHLGSHYPTWKLHTQFVGLAGDCLVLEDGPEINDQEAEQEEHGNEIIEGLSPQAQAIESVALIDHSGNVRMIETTST